MGEILDDKGRLLNLRSHASLNLDHIHAHIRSPTHKVLDVKTDVLCQAFREVPDIISDFFRVIFVLKLSGKFF